MAKAKSKRKRQAEARNKAEGKKILYITLAVTLVALVMLYLGFSRMG